MMNENKDAQPKLDDKWASSKDAPWAGLKLPERGYDIYPFTDPSDGVEREPLAALPVVDHLYLVAPDPEENYFMWFFFERYPASEDGLHEHPNLLSECALVQFLDYSEEHPARDDGLVVAKVIDVVPLRDFCKRFDPKSDTPADRQLVPVDKSSNYTSYHWHEDLCYIDTNYESDVVLWAICQRTSTGDVLLMLAGRGFDWSYCAAGYRPLSSDESRAIFSPSA
jgi:hypothetical protein